jgi:hypothetical protein
MTGAEAEEWARGNPVEAAQVIKMAVLIVDDICDALRSQHRGEYFRGGRSRSRNRNKPGGIQANLNALREEVWHELSGREKGIRSPQQDSSGE